jgi:hypothetical protein
VENARIGDELARVRVVDHLVDIDRDGLVRLLAEALGLDLARDGGELSVPVVADGRAADHATTLPGVGPIDLGIHQLDRSLDIARVERAVGGPQQPLGLRHATNLTGGHESGPLLLGARASSDRGAASTHMNRVRSCLP